MHASGGGREEGEGRLKVRCYQVGAEILIFYQYQEPQLGGTRVTAMEFAGEHYEEGSKYIDWIR